MRSNKTKKEYPADFKTLFGVSTLGSVSAATAALMTTWFMVYLTDYSGVEVALATTLLFVGRVIGACLNPVQGLIIDSAKENKLGKYKTFCLVSIVMIGVSSSLLYSLPEAITDSSVPLTIAWILVFYVMYEMGVSFLAEAPLRQSLTKDTILRAKHSTWAKTVTLAISMVMSAIMLIVGFVDNYFNNIRISFSVAVPVMILPLAVLSIIGVSLVKEGKHFESLDANGKREKVKVKDILLVFKNNKALKVNLISGFFGGFVFWLVFAVATYYFKYTYCFDPLTGAVDNDLFEKLSVLIGMLTIFPMLIGSFISSMMIKKMGSPVKVLVIGKLLAAVGGIALFLCHHFGLLQESIVLYAIIMFVITSGSGLEHVPANNISLECMDYNVYIGGKEHNGSISGVGGLIFKMQTAISSVIVGSILVAIGYVVDPVSGAFLGSLETIPSMLTGFSIVGGLIPALLCIISSAIYKFYPITPKVREEIKSGAMKDVEDSEDAMENNRKA